jgi:diacylglycerol O-acyltransferase / wax synthase
VSPEAIRRLSDEDLSILALESETVAGHTCKVILVDEQLDAARLRASIASRIDQAMPLRLRLAEVDGELWWELDPELDLNEHVVVNDDPEPLDAAGLRAAVADAFMRRLDRSRPLWRIELVRRLADGGSALIWCFHHAVADGSTIMDVARAALWDEAPVGDGGTSRRSPAKTPKGRSDRGAVPAAGGVRLTGMGVAVRQMPHPWLRSPFDGRVDARRSVALVSVGLDAMRQAARATNGATVNDAILTVVAGGLRGWLELHNGHLGSVRVKVPVSLHGVATAGNGASEPGNRDSFFCLDLPLNPADPLARLRAVRRATRVRKESHDAEQLDALMRRLGRVPQLRRFADRVLTSPRSFAVNVSNVRGPERPVHVLGATVTELYSLAEIREHHALRIAVVSLGETLNFGLTADATLLPDVDQLADQIRADADALVARVQYV